MMRNTMLYLCILFSIEATGQSYGGKVPAAKLPLTAAHYLDELEGDEAVDPQAWKTQPHGLNVSFASGDELYFRKDVPHVSSLQQDFTAWKGERINAQILVWSPDTVLQVRFRLHDLTDGNGHTIRTASMNTHMVRYVLSNYPYGAKDAVCGNTPYSDGYLMPDRLEVFDRFDLPGNTVRPVWFSIDIPATAAAGLYKGIIDVLSDKEVKRVSISVSVQNRLLAPPTAWNYRLDLWQNPWAVAWYNHVEPWSEEHKALLKNHLQLYANAGGKYITTYAVHSPWGDNSFMIEGGMIEWIRNRDSSWTFDYKIFDEYVQLAMHYGINKAITIYTPLPWGERFRYKDAATGNYVYQRWVPESEAFKKNWNSFLSDLRKHLLKKGWLGITYLGINENTMEQTLAAIRVLKQHSPEWRITYAGDWHEQLDTLLNDYSYLYGKEPTAQQQAKRKARGASTTFYVCCNPPYPNNFVFSPPIEGRWISWYSAAAGYDGFLRWAYDAWPADPMRDARHGSWPAGDCFLIYPGGNSSIRFEKLREGIADFEKIGALKKDAIKSKNEKVQQLWQQLEKQFQAIASEKEFSTAKITTDINNGKAILNQLTDLLPDAK